MQKPTKRHYRDNTEYRDILTHDNRHQLFLISPIPTHSIIAVRPILLIHVSHEEETFALDVDSVGPV